MYELEFTKRFLKDVSRLKSNKYFKKEELEKVFKLLKSDKLIPSKYLNHKLQGDMLGMYDLHVQNDLVLIYKKDTRVKLISLMRLGSHSELF